MRREDSRRAGRVHGAQHEVHCVAHRTLRGARCAVGDLRLSLHEPSACVYPAGRSISRRAADHITAGGVSAPQRAPGRSQPRMQAPPGRDKMFQTCAVRRVESGKFVCDVCAAGNAIIF